MTGWKIVCPDGKERHYPYTNHGDALFDAEHYRPHGRCEGCPGGVHTVDPIPAYQPPNPSGTSPHGAS